MDPRRAFLFAVAAAILVSVSSRAVNISNTWMLPEEGFPVFYRYFRDRISWYEADAVCQFHHANLVTVDSTSQFDAVRAYLKELDIVNNVWIGLSKNSEKLHFTWTDFRPLSNEGHWQEAIPVGNDALCAAVDPAADFHWHALSCGGPEVASFICELPVPTWASGSRGCLLTELPSLTVLYIPEQSALELTSDCGLDGTKRIACRGDIDRDEMMRQLSCSISNDDYDEKSTKPSIIGNTIPDSSYSETISPSSNDIKTTKPWIWTSNTIDTGEYGSPTRHRRETENTVGFSSTRSTTDLNMYARMNREQTTTNPSTFTKQAKPNLNSNIDTVTQSVLNDVTLDLSITHATDKSPEIGATPAHELTTQEQSRQPEEQAETFGTSTTIGDSKGGEVGQEDAAEYPGVINQGQLFSIIENGTMFDIIELNDTGTEDSNPAKSSFTPPHNTHDKENVNTKYTTAATRNGNALYTTVIYHKEPPEDTTHVTNKANKIDNLSKEEVTPTFKAYESSKNALNTKEHHKQKTINDLSSKDDDKILSKEVEMFPIVPNSLVKLNRTFRKELPMIENNLKKSDEDSSPLKKSIPFPETDKRFLEIPNHKVVEIKLHKNGNKNIHTKLFVTTKIAEKTKKTDKSAKVISNSKRANNLNLDKKDNATINPVINKKNDSEDYDVREINTNINSTEADMNESAIHEIDPKIDQLNINVSKNNESEIITPINSFGPSTQDSFKEIFLPKSLLNERLAFETTKLMESESESDADMQSSTMLINTTEEPVEPEPQAQPRPNRQRLLTKPQRRSFYPYFFSRVLG